MSYLFSGEGRANWRRTPTQLNLLLSAALVCPAAFLPVTAHAQDNDGAYVLEQRSQIVVTATRLPIKAEDAPVSVTTKTDEQIADELATDIKDMVRFEPGVSVQRQPARFNAALSAVGRAGSEGFTIRGIGGNRVLVQVDGVRVPDGFSFGAQATGRGDYVDIGLIKSVEILRGPASALYGSDGLSGAVSFVTADPADFIRDNNSFGGLARASFSSADNEFAETGVVAARSGDWSAMLAITRRDFGELDNQGTVGGWGALRTLPNPQDGQSNAALARIVYAPASGHKLRLTGEWVNTLLFTEVLSGRSATVELLEARDTSKRKRVSADWNWEGDGVINSARAALFWQDGRDSQFTDEDRTPLPDRQRRNGFENRVIGFAADARADFATGAILHRLVFGGDISKTRQFGVRDGTVPPAGEVFPTRAFPVTDFTRSGLFVGDEIAIADGRLTLYPALRFDWYDLSPQRDALLPAFIAAGQSGSRLSPKLGAVVKVGDEVRLFANFATGFKAPEPGQVNQFFENLTSPFFSYRTLPNPDLAPERSESFEGGVRFISNAVRLDVTVFSARYKDFISQEQVGGAGTIANPIIFQYVNLSRVNVTGAEAKFEARSRSGLNGSLALSYAKGDVIGRAGARSPLSTIDPLKLVAGVGYRQSTGRYGGQLILTHSAQMQASRAVGVCTPTCLLPDAFTIVDATAFARLTKGLVLRAGVFNLLDKEYAWWSDVRGLASTTAVADAFTQPGRNASVSLSYHF